MKRIILLITVASLMATMMVAMAGSALADAPPNEHNCAGGFSSGVTPESTSSRDFGAAVSAQAQAGTRDEFILGLADNLANCGVAI